MLANPPYSIKQWNREAFSTDIYGRNLWGTPPQGRADYAFFQHIVASLNPKNGRCAVLFPHGVLFRDEEREMREKLIKSDLIECIIGLGPNLFFNSPMEACIVICRTRKGMAHKDGVLFINAVGEVTRKNAQSYLEPSHIEKIVQVYENASAIDGFSKFASLKEIAKNRYSLSIAKYIFIAESAKEVPFDSQECISSWLPCHGKVLENFELLIKSL